MGGGLPDLLQYNKGEGGVSRDPKFVLHNIWTAPKWRDISLAITPTTVQVDLLSMLVLADILPVSCSQLPLRPIFASPHCCNRCLSLETLPYEDDQCRKYKVLGR